MDLIRVEDLVIDFKTDEGVIHAVKGISFSIPKGKTVGLVGESGSGKSVTSLSIMRLIASPPGEIKGGRIFYKEQNLLELKEREIRTIRGNKISMIFQEPMTSLNPVFTIGDQVAEALMLHKGMSKSAALARTVELLDQVGIPNPASRINSYPHELSGGQRQRVMIAMAISCEPELLIADEPTTALDVTIQKQILELISSLQKKYGMSVLFITHDLGVVGDIADQVVVMYKGQIVEQGPKSEIFENAKHPYTKGLMACRPTLDKNPRRFPTITDFMPEDGQEKKFDLSILKTPKVQRPITAENPVILEIRNVKKYFTLEKTLFGKPKSFVKAVNGVTLEVRKGRTLGLVGESGCGKTTLGRAIVRLIETTEGDIRYKGQDIGKLSPKEMRQLRRKMQIVFQDPYASLNPRMTIGAAIMEPMIIHKLETDRKRRVERTAQLLTRVGLDASMLNRYPHEFSGGQRQRICIARALAVEPEFIVCDESVSALDVSVQAQILNLLLDLQDEFNLSYVFISHDLAVVNYIADEVAVMYNGEIVERSDAVSIYKNPQHEYTKKLLSAIPKGIPLTL